MLFQHAHDDGLQAALEQYKVAGWGDMLKGVGGAAVQGAKGIGSAVANAGRNFGGAVATAGKNIAQEARAQAPALLDKGRQFLQGQAAGVSQVGAGVHDMLSANPSAAGRTVAWNGVKKLAPTAGILGAAYLYGKGGDRPAPQQQMQQPQQEEQQMHPQYTNQLASLYPAPRY